MLSLGSNQVLLVISFLLLSLHLLLLLRHAWSICSLRHLTYKLRECCVILRSRLLWLPCFSLLLWVIVSLLWLTTASLLRLLLHCILLLSRCKLLFQHLFLHELLVESEFFTLLLNFKFKLVLFSIAWGNNLSFLLNTSAAWIRSFTLSCPRSLLVWLVGLSKNYMMLFLLVFIILLLLSLVLYKLLITLVLSRFRVILDTQLPGVHHIDRVPGRTLPHLPMPLVSWAGLNL